MAPRVLAEARLPPIVSYSDPADPQLTLSWTLLDSAHPVTVGLTTASVPSFFPLVNCLHIQEADTGETVGLPTVDVNGSTAPPLRLVPEQKERFVTLHPGVPHVWSVSFRPFGHEVFTPERIKAMGSKRYRLLRLGMQLLRIGRRYTIRVRDGLTIDAWMEGDLEDLIRGSEWKPRWDDPIYVTSAEAVEFCVEE
ncbi:hypothetical protein VTN77DRAFT_6584 [Rasamsonia byssochlamydoides]|uniref:uncharacterized protein n=1 Tax=Rasamsonia byssochlamydoides TaxID=89139 RepID=UPI003743C23A